MTMRTLLVALSLCAAVLVPATAAQRPGADPDWPCQQRLVPTLSAATFWSGPDPAAAGDWRKEPKVAELVQRITPRRVAAEQGEQALAGFVADVGPQGARDRLLTLAFAGLLEETNRERIALIERIRDLGHRQRGLADIASEAGEELRQIPPTATGDEAARRTDLEQRFEFVTRAFDSGQRTIRYVCDAPVQLEARLGRYARFLQNHR
jgi:hypothetical protein